MQSVTPPRQKALDALAAGDVTVAQVALRVFGSDAAKHRTHARMLLYWLIEQGLAERVRKGEFRVKSVATVAVNGQAG